MPAVDALLVGSGARHQRIGEPSGARGRVIAAATRMAPVAATP